MSDPAVSSVEAATYVVPTDAPEGDGTFAWDSTTVVLVEVAAGGRTGLGWTYGAPACASLVESTLADAITGRDPFDVPGAHEALVRAVRNIGWSGVASYAVSAIDVALWDLKARLLDTSLGTLLGRAGEVPVYGSGGFTTYAEKQLSDQVTGWLAKDIPRVKIKIGESWGARPDRDLSRIAQVRGLVGADVEVFVDANGGYQRKQAIRVAERFAEHGVRWFEEPVSSDHLAGLREIREAVSCDVAAGEYGTDIFYFRRMCEARAVDCLQVDASRCGGITGFRAAAAVAASYGLQVSGHCAPNLHADVAAATPNLRHLEWFHDHVRIESMFFEGARDPRGGTISSDPAAPGHGLTLRSSEAERFRVG